MLLSSNVCVVDNRLKSYRCVVVKEVINCDVVRDRDFTYQRTFWLKIPICLLRLFQWFSVWLSHGVARGMTDVKVRVCCTCVKLAVSRSDYDVQCHECHGKCQTIQNVVCFSFRFNYVCLRSLNICTINWSTLYSTSCWINMSCHHVCIAPTLLTIKSFTLFHKKYHQITTNKSGPDDHQPWQLVVRFTAFDLIVLLVHCLI